MNKAVLERACRLAGLTPERKETVREGEIYVADGFNARPGVTFQRFGATEGEFPFGAYATVWWVADGEDKIIAGVPLLFDAMHDGGKGWDLETRRRARINTALLEARAFLKRRERVRRDGIAK